jgi:hypothetical protein
MKNHLIPNLTLIIMTVSLVPAAQASLSSMDLASLIYDVQIMQSLIDTQNPLLVKRTNNPQQDISRFNLVIKEYQTNKQALIKNFGYKPLLVTGVNTIQELQERIDYLKTQMDDYCNEIGQRGVTQVLGTIKKMVSQHWDIGASKNLCNSCRNSWETGGVSKDPARKHPWVKRAVC